MILPVSIKPHVEALTNVESLLPMCDFQSPSSNLSLISFSAVPLSGILSKASAIHISTIPSLDDKSYSFIKASTPSISLIWLLTFLTNLTASSLISARALKPGLACSSSSLTKVFSSLRKFSDNPLIGDVF